MTSSRAPLALFAYRRTQHLAAVLDSLERCPEFSDTPVHVFSDGPRDHNAVADVAAVRAMLAARRRSNMTIVEATANRGLARSIIAGVTELCSSHGRVIVIEDDLVVSPATLTWFNAALDRYADAQSVWQISAHQFAVPQFRDRGEAMFLNFSTSWGWATWDRAWKGFDPDAPGWEQLAQDSDLRRRFDCGGAYPYAHMLEQQMGGKIDSWAIRWWWSMFRNSALGLFPPRPLVSNIGEDGTATHAPSLLTRLFTPSQQTNLAQTAPDFPPTVAPDAYAQAALENRLRRRNGRFAWGRSLLARFA
jgi:hypothetical protein